MIETCFYYYGCVLPLAEITSLMVQYKKNDPYCFILDQGLQYRRVGEVEKTYRIVIGKEIALFTDKNPYHLDKNNPYTEMYQDDIHTYRIKKKDKMDIANKLLLVGCYNIPKYYATYNYSLEDFEKPVEDSN